MSENSSVFGFDFKFPKEQRLYNIAARGNEKDSSRAPAILL